MPFIYPLPTTSPLPYPSLLTSPLYPSLPLSLHRTRSHLRLLLKRYKRASPQQKSSLLSSLLAALNAYLPLLSLTLDLLHSGEALLTGSSISSSWRATLTSPKSPLPRAESPRIIRESLHYELAFTLSTLAYTYSLLSSLPSTAPQPALQHLTTAAGIFHYSSLAARPPSAQPWPLDISPPVLAALSSLTLATAHLKFIVKDDPYPASTSHANQSDFYTPPTPPSGVRANLFARICVAAGEHAAAAVGGVDVEGVRKEITAYAKELEGVARAKAARFLGVVAEQEGRVGEAVGWCVVARGYLGVGEEKKHRFRISKDKPEKPSKGGYEGDIGDTGKEEELRVVRALEKEWRKVNDSVLFQPVVEEGVLIGRIPTGREAVKVPGWKLPDVSREEMEKMKSHNFARTRWEDEVEEEEDSEDEAASSGRKMPGGMEGYY